MDIVCFILIFYFFCYPGSDGVYSIVKVLLPHCQIYSKRIDKNMFPFSELNIQNVQGIVIVNGEKAKTPPSNAK